MNRLAHLVSALLLSFGSAAVAQNPGTGVYAFGSFDSRGFDTVNIGNLNTHFEIPIVNKQGRGLPFAYSLSYDGLIWSPSSSGGSGSWQADSGWGFHGALLGGGFAGYLSYSEETIQCSGGDGGGALLIEGGDGTPVNQPTYGTFTTNFVYHDAYGRNHLFNYSVQACDGQGTTPFGDGSTSDGSGYSYGINDGMVHSRNGQVINAPTVNSAMARSSVTDSNGNTVSNNGNGTFTDTLGITALTIGGSGTAASPLTLAYPVTLQSDSATSATTTIYYKTYTVQTNFRCPGIVEYGATSTDLMDHIALPDGSTYSFTYEATPGVAGAVTGRLASVTLPTAGTVNYSYGGGCSSSGINADGTVANLTRTTLDGTRTYTRATVNANATTTTVQDEKQQQTVYQFSISSGLSAGMFFETQRDVYAGNTSSPNLLDRQTCYNGASAPCNGAAVIPPFTQMTIANSYNGGPSDTVANTYSSSGLLQSSVRSQGVTTWLSQSASYNALAEPTVSSTYDGVSNLVAQTTFGYDETGATPTSGIPQHNVITSSPGNQTSSHVMTAPGTTLDTSTTYYDTGVPFAAHTPNGTTGYGYDSTQTFLTQIALPTPSSGVALATSATYDPQSGAVLSATGMNAGQNSQITQYDRLLRPTIVTLPNSGRINYNYVSPTRFGVSQAMDNFTNADTETLLDGYGRVSRVAVSNGQRNNRWYQTDYCYDATGLLQFQSTPYQSYGFGPQKQCSGNGTSYLYDALGRVTSITNADGPTTILSSGRAVKSTDVNNVQKITQYDILGRISGVCEISSNASMPGSGSPVNCGMDIAGTGFLTTYMYDLANHKTTITQGAQVRVFQTDAAGRTVSATEPERGVTTYSYAYNGTGLAVTRTRPRANQTNPAVLTHTTTQYDSIGRPVSVAYDDGTPLKLFQYDTASGAGWPNGSSALNVKGQLTSMSTRPLIAPISSALFSYDIMGNVASLWQCAPSTCPSSTAMVSRPVSYSYDLAGNLLSESDSVSGTIAYGRSPAGEVTSVTNQTYQGAGNPANLVSNVVNGPNGPISYVLGNGLNSVSTYDSLGRGNGGYACVNSTQPGCAGGTERYGYGVAWKGTRLQSSADTVNNSATYGYDEFNRLQSTNIGNGAQTFSYGYDRYGNRLQQNAPQGGPAPQYSVSTANNQITSFAYDAAGNLLNDGINSYAYDAEGNLLSVGGTAQYVYDALNRRASVQTTSATNEYVFDAAGRRVSTWAAATNTGTEGRIYWGGQQIAYRAADGTTYFDHKDWLGTERMRTTYTGAVASGYTSLPWGDGYTANETNPNGNAQDNSHFALLDHDNESNTDHAQFRQFSNMQGRWMSPDPYDKSYDAGNPQSLNRYTYALNNPIRYLDPRGRDVTVCATAGDCYTYSDSTWDQILKDGYGGGITDDGQGNLICPDGSVCGQVWWSPNFWPGQGGFDNAPPHSGYDDTAPSIRPPNPVNGPWTYGNHCGAGGEGAAVDPTDAGCRGHDTCFSTIGADFTSMMNSNTFSSLPPQNQQRIAACNSQLCNSERSVRDSIPMWDLKQNIANAEIIGFFSYAVPEGARCQSPH